MADGLPLCCKSKFRAEVTDTFFFTVCDLNLLYDVKLKLKSLDVYKSDDYPLNIELSYVAATESTYLLSDGLNVRIIQEKRT